VIRGDELPPGWAWATIGELCDINPKHRADYADTLAVSFVPMAAVDEATGQIVGATDRPYGEVRKGYTHFAEGDVLWAKITPCMENGKSAVARGLTNGIGCGTTEFVVLRSRGAVLPEYLHRFMRQMRYRRAARRTMQSGVGQARVPKEFIESTLLPVPPLAEQRRITDKVDNLLDTSRRVGTSLDSVPNLLGKYRESVLTAAFTGALTEQFRRASGPLSCPRKALATLRDTRSGKGVKSQRRDYWDDDPQNGCSSQLPALPNEWEWATWGQLSEWITYGFTRPMPHVSEGPRIVTAKNVRTGTLDLSDTHRTTEAAFGALSAKDLPKPGDILITKDGSIGRAALVPDGERFCINQSVAVVFLRACPFDRRFLLRMIEAPLTQRLIQEQTAGMALPHLSISDFARMPVPIPPIEEQRVIAQQIEDHLSHSRRISEVQNGVTNDLDVLRESTLARAFAGELVSQNPEDEPSSVLLERIRTERASAPAPRRVRRTGAGL
jgi:type I restriction enzyme, S subunit